MSRKADNEEEEVDYDAFSAHALANIPIIGFVSQMTAAYNFTSVAVAEDVMKRDNFYIPSWATDCLDSGVYGGAIIGMFTMGFVGDRIGRSWGMLVTLTLTMIGAIASGCSFGSDEHQIIFITGCRFVLGFGIGGTYPLSSSAAADSTAGQKLMARRVSVGWAYVGQGPGYMLPYFLAMACAWVEISKDAAWRALLIGGAVPVLVIFRDALAQKDSAAFTKKRNSLGSDASVESHFNTLLWTSKYQLKLAGTGGTWFLYDFVSFGVKMFAPALVEEIFTGADDDSSESIMDVCWQNMLLNAIGIPALLVTIHMVSRHTPKTLLTWSFIGQSACFVILGMKNLFGLGNAKSSFFVLAVLYFFQNFGCGLCNYVIAAESYPVEVRSSFAGISSAIGKSGAIFGIVFFQYMINEWGYGYTLLFCSGVSFLGFYFTILFVESNSEMENDMAPAPGDLTPLLSNQNSDEVNKI